MAFFSVLKQSKLSGSRARLGRIETSHGSVMTPAFIPVATKGSLKSLSPYHIREIGIQASFVNSYHIAVHPGTDVVRSHGSMHTFAQMPRTLFSDSGGFQVFSLAKSSREGRFRDGSQALVFSLKEDKVVFRSLYDGSLMEFSPESSMQHQINIGADILMSFDECTHYPATHDYSVRAMRRTHAWLMRCIRYLDSHARDDYPQFLYGVIQGGNYEDLRVESAEFVAHQGVAGIAIGGVSVGESKDEMRDQVRWVAPHLPVEKPVHLLGVGQIDDIVDLVRYGIDTFDCVEPTRLARMGVLLHTVEMDHMQQGAGPYGSTDILSHQWKDVTRLIESPSELARQFSYAYLHHLFKQKELLGYTIATSHNLSVMERLMQSIRELIADDHI